MTVSPEDIKPNVISRDTPVETAKLFRAQRHENMIKYNKDWLDWDGAAYQMIEDETIESEILLWLVDCKRLVAYDVLNKETGEMETKYRAEPFNPKAADVNQVNIATVRLYHVAPGSMDPPFFLDGGTGEHVGLVASDLISCQNGLLDINTRQMYAATPQFFTRTALPIAYDATAECPLWRTFLFQVLCDEQLVALMQQWFGYLITTDTSYQKLLYLRGRPRSGKGTTMRVLDALVGPRNVASHTISDIAERSGREGLVGKSLLKITDMNTDNKQDLSQAASIINAITGEDPIHIFRKFKGALELILKAHVVMAGNQFPDFGDHAAALSERMNVIPFNVSFSGREDSGLTAKLLAELAGILNWALDGLEDLRWDGKFMIAAAAEEAKREVLNSGSPVRGFVNDECEIGPEFVVSKDELFNAYDRYCTTIKAHPYSRNVFFSKLKTAEHGLQNVRTNTDGERERVIAGIRLKPDRLQPHTITKVYKLDPELVEMFGIVCDEAIMRGADGKLVEYGTAQDDFG
jgi:putative DNA primase/helicase